MEKLLKNHSNNFWNNPRSNSEINVWEETLEEIVKNFMEEFLNQTVEKFPKETTKKFPKQPFKELKNSSR